MNTLTPEEQAFVDELARRAVAENANGAYLIQTKIGRVHMTADEPNRLDPTCARVGKTGTELINSAL